MRYCGRHFELAEIDLIRQLLNTPQINRARLSREVCETLGWRRDNGALKDMSCRVALLRMQADGLITLPPPRNPKPVAYRSYPHIEQAVLEPATIPSIDLATLQVDPVLSKADSLLWNGYIEGHHYLGHQLMPGRNCATSCAPPATLSRPSASARALGRSNRGISSSVGRQSSDNATCTSS